jgi:acid phosphatase type 7
MRPYRATARVAVLILTLAVVSNCSQDDPTSTSQRDLPGPASAATVDPIVVAAGDIACGTGTAAGLPCRQAATAGLIGTIAPAAVLPLGDIQYENATLADFNTYYGPTWGVYKSITWPAAGNHEYQTAGAAGYFDYFNGVGVQSGRAGDRSKGYYSFNLGAWHLVAINSNCAAIGGCGAGSPQEQWLRADLAANPAVCTLAYWHHPRFSSGAAGNNSSLQPIWQALYDYGADLVLAGHDHEFERFAPQTATGTFDLAKGVRSFVVGTGGKDRRAFATIRANSEFRDNSSLGVLKLTLHADSYDWQFVPIPGDPLADAGTATCQAGSPPPPPPPTQTTLTIPANADAYTFRNSPTQAFGSASTLLVDASPAARTYLKFPVSGIGTKTILSAKLRLYAVDPSNAGGRLHRVSSTSWGESTITWSNAPAYSATVIGSIGSVVVNTWYEIDVRSQISGDGTVSFALESASTNGADYRSRESGGQWAPRLVIGVQ